MFFTIRTGLTYTYSIIHQLIWLQRNCN